MLQRRGDVRYRHFPPETIVVRQDGPEIMVFNAVAGRILELVDGRSSVRELASTLVSEYDAPRETLEADVARFAQELVEAGLVAVVPPEEGTR